MCHETHLAKNPCLSCIDARIRLLLCRQGEEQSTGDHAREFKARAEALKMVDGSPGISSDGVLFQTVKEHHQQTTGVANATNDDASTWSGEHVLAVLAIKNACNTRYSNLKAHLQNQYNKGADEYPTNVDRAFKMLQNYVPPRSPRPTVKVIKKTPEVETEVGLAQVEDEGGEDLVPSKDGKVHEGIEWRYCKKIGHYKSSCPKL